MVYVTCDQTFPMKSRLKNITNIKNVNQPVMNRPQKMRLETTQKTLLLRGKLIHEEGDGK